MNTAGRPPDPDDDDRTIIRVPGARSSPAPIAGGGHTLPIGTRIEGFEIVGLIGEGGFGIVYLAYDAALERQVAIKEYMPASLAARSGVGHEVSVKSERHRETFEVGLRSFVNEARLLARFDHPSLVKVFRFWEGNRTAYMAMPFYQGPTLKRALAELGGPPPEALLREWLRALLDALAVMHKEQCYHRDIAPDNILLTDRGPLLLDFGAARRVIGDMTHALTVVLKPGYAPIEQYGEASSMVQGPWTDLYALASVVHYAITGKAPITSVERIMGDRLEPLVSRAAGHYSAGFLQAIDAALAVKPQDRPQDVAQFRELLNVGLSPDHPDYFRASGFHPSGFGFHSSGFSHSSFDPLAAEAGSVARPAPPAPPVAPAVPPAPAPAARPARPREPVTAMPPMATHAPEAPPSGRVGKGAYAVVGLTLLAVGATVAYMRMREAAPTAAGAPTTATAPAPAPAAAPAVTPASAVAPWVPVEPAAPPPAAQAAPAPAPSPVIAPAPAPAPAPITAPVATAPRAEPAPAPAVPARRATPKAEVAEPAPSRSVGVRPARCSDILQKASLEPLSAEEAAFLKRECR
jgi:serine/threonine protein kinase